MTTLSQLRQQIEASKAEAMVRFEKDWGTRDVRKVAHALRVTIPTSSNPQDAASQARALLDDSNKQVVDHAFGADVTRGQLSAAFDLVVDKSNWKNPVDAIVDLDDRSLEMIRRAVIFFTGSVPSFEPRLGASLPKCRYRVRAIGYYQAIGA